MPSDAAQPAQPLDPAGRGHKPDAYATPGSVQVFEGFVVMMGPDAGAVSLTPEAAAETGRRLIAAARAARTAPPSR